MERDGLLARLGTGIGRVLPIARIVATVLAVLAFLVFVFSDNLLSSRMERAIENELEEQGMRRSSMRFTPVAGYETGESFRVDGELWDATLSADGAGLWITTSHGELLYFDLQERAVTDEVRPQGISSPEGVSLAEDGRLLITDPKAGLIAYVDDDGDTEVVYQETGGGEPQLIPMRAVERRGQLYAISEGDPAGVITWTQGRPSRVYGYTHITDILADNGYLFVTGGHESGLPVARLSSAGVDAFVNSDLSWAWALPYWDIPFVGLAVDPLDFITIVDAEGHLVQMSPSARVVLQSPPVDDSLGSARSVSVDPSGQVVVTYAHGLRLHALNTHGSMVRQAAHLTEMGEYRSALPIWQELVELEPESIPLRRWLGWSYLSTNQPRLAATEFYLAGDDDGFNAAIGAEAKRIRKEYLWEIWMGLMVVAVVLWVLNKAWPALVGPNGRAT